MKIPIRSLDQLESALEWLEQSIVRSMSDDQLLNIVARILARPSSTFTDMELEELNAINAEMQRRYPYRHNRFITEAGNA